MTGHRSEASVELDQLERDAAVLDDVAMPIVWCGARRRSVGEPGLKMAKPPRRLVQRDVRVPEDDRVGVGEAAAHPRQAPGGRPGVVDHRDPHAAGDDHLRTSGSRACSSAESTLPRTACTGGPSASSSSSTDAP